MTIPIPENELDRIKALNRYNILDTPPEQAFDDITLLASFICETPISLITLLDETRQWFKSKIGVSVPETSREIAFCNHAIMQPDILIIQNTLNDKRFATNSLVTRTPISDFMQVPNSSPLMAIHWAPYV